MASGPISPNSIIPVTANRIAFGVHVGAGSGAKRVEGMQFEASLGADSTWELAFPMPPEIPTGSPKLRYGLLANLSSNAAQINVKWASVAAGSDPSSATLNDEGTTGTTFTAADAIHEVKTALDAAAAPAANALLVMQIIGKTSSWTANQIVTLIRPEIIWE